MNLDPAWLFAQLARTVPADLHPNVLVVGSVAAGYHYRTEISGAVVQTKDADVVVRPAGAVTECESIATQLLAAGWERTAVCKPLPSSSQANALQAIRLHPPGSKSFFVELLGLPPPDQTEPRRFTPAS